mgnify:FL=1
MKKKRITKKTIKPKNAKPENYFILVTGVPLKNLKELASAAQMMNDWVFNHHVNDSRNDFATWCEHVLNEEDLANELVIARNPRDLEVIILRHIVNKYL